MNLRRDLRVFTKLSSNDRDVFLGAEAADLSETASVFLEARNRLLEKRSVNNGPYWAD